MEYLEPVQLRRSVEAPTGASYYCAKYQIGNLTVWRFRHFRKDGSPWFRQLILTPF